MPGLERHHQSTMQKKIRLGVLGSGKGSNFRAVLEAIQAGKLNAEVAIVISDVPGAGILQNASVDLVVLAGYMRMIKAPMLEGFPRRIINIHPSLLPKFPGLEAWKQALDAGEKKTGCTVHFVDSGMDTGDVISQAEVPVLPDDTAESLHARIQVQEHRIYPEVIARFAAHELP